MNILWDFSAKTIDTDFLFIFGVEMRHRRPFADGDAGSLCRRLPPLSAATRRSPAFENVSPVTL